jgi:hypothetical protein
MSEWIKCSDRLPEFNKPVLLYLKSRLKGIADVITDGIIKENFIYGTNNRDFMTRFYNESFYDLEYWASLPELPKD